jgi:5-(aminomethyl)-3-furanmethanol phosphate kinase
LEISPLERSEKGSVLPRRNSGKEKYMKVVVKIGGSLIDEAPELVDRLVKEFGPGNSRANENAYVGGELPFSILIVPGGGLFTDVVRAADEEYSLSANAAHWMAVLGMEQYAFHLWDKSRAAATDLITYIPPGVSILFPYKLLKTEDPLPHSWEVTSDTIAAWVAKQTEARFVKATDVDGILKEGTLIREVTADSITGNCASCIDPALPEFLLINGMNCLIVNGRYPERVVQAVYGMPVSGTLLKGNI